MVFGANKKRRVHQAKKKALLARFEKAVLGSFGKFEDFLPNCLTAYKWQNFNGSIFFHRMYCEKNQSKVLHAFSYSESSAIILSTRESGTSFLRRGAMVKRRKAGVIVVPCILRGSAKLAAFHTSIQACSITILLK